MASCSFHVALPKNKSSLGVNAFIRGNNHQFKSRDRLQGSGSRMFSKLAANNIGLSSKLSQ